MQSHNNVVQNAKGDVLQGAVVSVYDSGTSNLSTIYSDNGVTAKANPITADSDGAFVFWAGNGRYDVTTVYGSDTNTYEIILFDSVEDPVLIDNGSDLEIGDPGTESGGVNVNGTIYDAKLRINDIGGTKPAQTVLHRHSTTLASVLLGTRSNSDDSTHAAVTNSQGLFAVLGGGWTGSHYDLFGAINFNADATGTISATSSPGQITLQTVPDSSNTLTTALTIDSAQKVGIGISTPDTKLHVWNGSAGTVSAIADTVFTVENSTNAFISILAPDTSRVGLKFGSPSANNIGSVEYLLNSNDLLFRVDSSNAAYITSTKNFGLGTNTFGADANTVIGIPNSPSAPTTSPADMIQIYSKDSTSPAATLAIRTEQVVEAIGTFTASHKLRVWINEVEYWIQLDAV